MESVLLMCKLLFDTSDANRLVALDVNSATSFVEILGKLCERWPYLRIEDLDLKYSVMSYEHCCLNNEADLLCMFRLITVYSLKVVEIHVYSKSIVAENNRIEYNITRTDSALTECTTECSSDNTMAEYSNKKVYMGAHWVKLLKDEGQVFYGGVNEFRDSLEKFCVESGFSFRCIRNSKTCVTAICTRTSFPGCKCNWSVTASIQRSTKAFILRKFHKVHQCNLEIITEKGITLSSKIISQLIEHKVREKPTISALAVIDHMFQEYGYTTTFKKAWMAILGANKRIFGDYGKAYKDLRWYCALTLFQNPGSHIVLEVDDTTNRFQRLFVSYGACIRGFAYVRPMLFIDGTHLFGKYKSTLLCATGKNGNQGLYPLAFAVVDSETVDNWIWFLQQLRCVVNEDRRLSFFSDRNLGLLQAVPSVFPDHDHYFCIHHMKENLKLKFSGGPYPAFKKDRMVELFQKCAYASSVTLFNQYMDVMLQEGGIVIRNFLQGVPEKNWAKAFSVGCRYGEMTTSAVESINSWALDVRALPIVQLIEGIRSKLMKWHLDRKTDSGKWTTILCKGIGERICQRMEKVRGWVPSRSSLYTFEVREELSYVVDVSKRYCSCGRWQIDAFPCDHALACFLRVRDLQIHMYIDSYFFTCEYRKSYEEPIYPVPSSLKAEFEPIGLPLILPPSTKRPSGRPKKKRYKSRSEKERNTKFTCGRCGKQGHSKRTCKEPI